MCDAKFFERAYRHLDDAERLAKDDPAILTRIGRERLVVDSAYLWTHESVRRVDPSVAAKLPKRSVVMKRIGKIGKVTWLRHLTPKGSSWRLRSSNEVFKLSSVRKVRIRIGFPKPCLREKAISSSTVNSRSRPGKQHEYNVGTDGDRERS